MKKLKIGIIGVGNIGKRHAKHVSELAELVAVCDINPVELKKVKEEYDCKTYTNIDDFLQNKFDLVSICTPNNLHAEHSIKTLKANNHVLCEKPMALSSADCEKMMITAEQTNKRLFIVKQNRFNPPVEAVKEVIDGGDIGDVLSVHISCFWNRNPDYYKKSIWKGKKELDGGTLFTQFSHFIDIIYWLIGDIKEVHGFKDNFIHKDLVEFEDCGVVSLKFENGALGTIHYTINSHPRNIEGSITIFGSKGTVKIGGEYLNKIEYQSFDNYVINDLDESKGANDYGTYKGSMSNHDKVYKNIIDVLQNNKPIVTNMIQGYKVVDIIEKIYEVSK